ncbi:hypothetical protein DPMN_035191 [Dreissena polymorpha]|uniref:Uncharacterized protein n=1 Tax=Dreissena polymorpha TaxID=45954 RepID=A0A9D4MBF5_DREPO|nr:hypothetical protein DPMN_035191 [Dreissena polymorpha]
MPSSCILYLRPCSLSLVVKTSLYTKMVTKNYAKGLTKTNFIIRQNSYSVQLVAQSCTGVYFCLERFICCMSLVWKQGKHSRYSNSAYKNLDHTQLLAP